MSSETGSRRAHFSATLAASFESIMDEFEWVKTFATSNYGTVSDAPFSPPKPHSASTATSRGSFASFVCHVVNLERKLRSFSPLVLDDSSNVRITGKILGQGKTFMVRHAQWIRHPRAPPLDVALKEIIPDAQSSDGTSSVSSGSSRPQTDWKDILFELRALLHEPIRYHPNLVRLLGIQWGLSPISESTYPALIMEYASLGTFQTLQASSEPLPFPVKQKLCYDVGRGLSALHACGIVHGDMKHENVLIFPCRDPIGSIQYTAKLADFGGAVMDMTSSEFRNMESWTWPFQAPEINNHQPLSKAGMMLADVYSFGLLIWRAFMDGEGFVSLPGALQTAVDEEKRGLSALKASDDFTNTAIADIYGYAAERGLSQTCFDLMVYAIIHTVQFNPRNRDLVKAQAALRGIRPGHVIGYLRFVREKNEEREAIRARIVPGRHGISMDSVKFYSGREGNDEDLQDNMPGFRPRLGEPNPEEFLFEPENLKLILTWGQQQQMLTEMKEAASGIYRTKNGLVELPNTVAAFYVFQCYLLEFGTTFNAEEAVQWLLKAASDDHSHTDADYLSQAWLCRISRALSVDIDIKIGRRDDLLRRSVERGHRTCLQDIDQLVSSNRRSRQNLQFEISRRILLSQMGGVGMNYFRPKCLRRPWDTITLDKTTELEECIRKMLGSDYESCLKSPSSESESRMQQSQDKESTAFDRIYINRQGHGLLHYAAAADAPSALQHMVMKYKCDVNIPNQHVHETPLVCACEGGNVDCALLLLNNGADPNGCQYGDEGPLHWLCSFPSSEMENFASRLVAAGADLELRSSGMRHDLRGIRADWEHLFEIKTTPLGRAVLMNNLDAVQVLLKLGANPLTKSANKHRGEWEGKVTMTKMIDVSSPFELAAVLTLPEILAKFIKHIDGPDGVPRSKLLEDFSMLDLAHEKKVTKFDPLSLQSRLVRCGQNYKESMRKTLRSLRARSLLFHDEEGPKKRSRVLCKEVALGNLDVVESLLHSGYNANGTQDFRPLEKAIEANHETMFELLRKYEADATVTRMTPTGSISLLHVCAARSRYSRPGRAIADSLIAAGVPIESADLRSRPPLATAILHQNFDVARALLENGANVDATYPLQFNTANGSETKAVSVLVEVLSQHTMRTLESLKFLFGGEGHSMWKRPAFHIDPANKFSILHLLAGSPHFTHIAQITPQILILCLKAYAQSEFINYKHPLLGTALYFAATSGHKLMVERLLQCGADETYQAGPDVNDSVHTLLRPRESWTPLWAAILRFDDELRKSTMFPPEGPAGAWLHSNLIQNVEKVISMLSQHSDDVLAKQAIDQLGRRKQSLEAEFRASKINKANKRREFKARESESPVDLSILSSKSSRKDEMKMREIFERPEQEWKSRELEGRLKSLMILPATSVTPCAVEVGIASSGCR